MSLWLIDERNSPEWTQPNFRDSYTSFSSMWTKSQVNDAKKLSGKLVTPELVKQQEKQLAEIAMYGYEAFMKSNIKKNCRVR